MFFRKKRRRRQQSNPPWVMWLLIGFVVMALLSNYQKGTPENPNKVHEAFEQAGEELNPKKFFNLDDYKSKIFPTPVLRSKDVEPGNGQPAACGQTVHITYDAFLENGTAISDKADKDNPLVFRIGEGKVVPALEQGVIGMKPGGKRSLIAQGSLAYGAPPFARPDVPADAPVRFEVNLLEATPALPEGPFRIADVQNLPGAPVLCGTLVKLQMTIWGVDGKKLYSSRDGEGKPVSFTPGKSEVFFGLEQGVIGMTAGSARSLIVPPDYQTPLGGNPPGVDFPFPEEQTVLVDVEALP